MRSQNSTLFCGIDFGTTNSTVAIYRNGKVEALPIDEKNSNTKILKSLLYVNPNKEKEIGWGAIERYLWDVKNVPSQKPRLFFTGKMIKTVEASGIQGVGKVIMVPEIIEIDDSGRGRLLQSLKSVLTSETFKGTNLFGEFISLEDLLVMLLGEIKKRAEERAGEEIDNVVLGRPVRYVGDDKEKIALERMEKVAKLAGFKRIAFEYEPVGAALDYGIDIQHAQQVLVFDFGGGTLDVCVMEFPSKKILSVAGRPIGGDLMNSRIMENKILKYFGGEVVISGRMKMPNHILSAISKNWYRISMLKNVKDLESLEYFIMNSDDPTPLYNLRSLIINDFGYTLFKAIDEAKIKLSESDETELEFRCEDFTVKEKIERGEFEKMIKEDVEETEACIKEALQSAGFEAKDIDKVLITGGSSKIPAFLNLLKRTFGEEKLNWSDPFTTVAIGLSIRAKEIFS